MANVAAVELDCCGCIDAEADANEDTKSINDSISPSTRLVIGVIELYTVSA
jgi:hypothetical protein